MDNRRTGLSEALQYTSAGSSAEAIAGIVAVVLSIIALAGTTSISLVSIAAMAIGLAYVFQGSGISARFAEITSAVPGHESQLRGGLMTEFIGGLAGVALGILSIIGLIPLTLLPIAAIVLGFTSLGGTNTISGLNSIAIPETGREKVNEDVNNMVRASMSVQVIAGLGAIVLGVIALIVQKDILTLSVIGLLALGVVEFFSGASVAGKLRKFLS